MAGLIIAEKEMGSIDEEVIIPSWVKSYIEVTDSLTNLHLAKLASDLAGTNAAPLSYINQHILCKIPRIDITGAPCSGKTTIIDLLKKEMPEIHFLPEMATIVIDELGIRPSSDLYYLRKFQITMYRAQRTFENTSTEYAVSQNKTGVVFDRGTVDGAAYFQGGMQEFEKTLQTTQVSEYQNYDQAKELSKRIIGVWENHPKFKLINETIWDKKVETVRHAIQNHIKI